MSVNMEATRWTELDGKRKVLIILLSILHFSIAWYVNSFFHSSFPFIFALVCTVPAMLCIVYLLTKVFYLRNAAAIVGTPALIAFVITVAIYVWFWILVIGTYS